jgi:hypothetical protein
MSGRWDGGELPMTYIEHLFAKWYGFDFEYTNKLPAKKVQEHSLMLIMTEKLRSRSLFG